MTVWVGGVAVAGCCLGAPMAYALLPLAAVCPLATPEPSDAEYLQATWQTEAELNMSAAKRSLVTASSYPLTKQSRSQGLRLQQWWNKLENMRRMAADSMDMLLHVSADSAKLQQERPTFLEAVSALAFNQWWESMSAEPITPPGPEES